MKHEYTRREFLKITGSSFLALSLSKLTIVSHALSSGSVAQAAEVGGGFVEYEYRSWEDIMRKQWSWDKVTWGVHLVDCYPGSCLWRVYTKNGIVWREEQAGKYPAVREDIPDMNPRGCQKGASYSHVMYGPERLKYPLKRMGQRGEGKWKRVSWDEALTDVADAMLDAIQEQGPESIIYEHSPGEGGYGGNGIIPGVRLCALLRTVQIDLDCVINDFNAGNYETFGKFQFASSGDDWFNADLLLIWHMNPVYTRIPFYHYITEAYWKGATVVTIAPDFSPSAIHADYYVPVKVGTDAALGLSMAKVMIDENIYNAAFIKEQTDMPLLVRMDTRKFLRESDMHEGGRTNQFYFHDVKNGIVKAPRKTLKYDGEPSLEGSFTARLKDGKEVEVKPVFELLKDQLKHYEPEEAYKMCGVHPDTIRMLARKMAKSKTHILVGWNSAKYYHGDLIERAQDLCLALTGNWGKRGTGTRGWSESLLPGMIAFIAKHAAGMVGTLDLLKLLDKTQREVIMEDPEQTDEMVAIETERRVLQDRLPMSPGAFYWYYHAGYREVWNNKEWSDNAMKRSFDSYLNEALDKGWWDGFVRPAKDITPRVFFGVAGSTLRRTRGGLKMLLKNAWPNYKMIVSVDTRISTTGMYADIVLPAAGFYEKVDVRFPSPHIPFVTFTDKAVEPVGESKNEWEIFCLLAKKLEQRAKARGMHGYTDRYGYKVELDNIYNAMTMNGDFSESEQEKVLDEMLKDSALMGTLPLGTDVNYLRKEGIVRFISVGRDDPVGLNEATDIEPHNTINPLTWHTEKKIPYPTLTQRAQFYIDHDWFFEAEEVLPTHKDNPAMGGKKYPFDMTSGHLRWSIHSIWVVNKLMLQTHRGEPFLFVNIDDAAKKGVKDGDMLKVFNDFNTFYVRAKVSPSVRPGQVIIYHAWEPYQFKGWKSYDAAIPGMINWKHLAGGYGHLKYWRWNWCLPQMDRGVRVDFEKA